MKALAFLAALLFSGAAYAQVFNTRSCDAAVVTTGSSPVTAISAPTGNGYYITNPLTAADQGIAAAENLYVDPTLTAGIGGNNTTSVLIPGQTFIGIGGSKNAVSANAVTSGHKFTCVRY